MKSLANRNMTSNFVEIKDHILNFYKHLYSEQYLWRPMVDGFSFRSIDVEEVMRNFNGDKARGPDKFSMAFF